ncbi:hypothetical protein VPH35_114023 [Triticum aestivum]
MTSTHNLSDLPDDLLHVVYVKVPGLLHRIRFAAVCRSWRASAIAPRHAAPPTIPWLLFSSSRDNGVNDSKTKNIYCPEDGQFLHIPLPSKAIGKRFVGGYDGGWVAMLGQDMQLAVVNLFSGVEVPLPAKDTSAILPGGSSNIIRKVVFSESPAISGCMLAAIIPQCGIAMCRVGCKDNRWTVKQLAHPRLKDIVFCNGRLYGFTLIEDVIKFDIGVNKDGRLVVIGEPHELRIRNLSDPVMCQNYIIEWHGKLAMVTRNFRVPYVKVFQLANESTSTTECTHRWEEVTSLGDNALFLGDMWSKTVYTAAAGCGRVQRSCIYMDDLTYSTWLDDQVDHEYDDAMWSIKSAGCSLINYASCRIWVLPPDI